MFLNILLKCLHWSKKGIDDLYKSIGNLFSMEEISLDNTTVITNVRHKNLISKALNSCREAKKINGIRYAFRYYSYIFKRNF